MRLRRTIIALGLVTSMGLTLAACGGQGESATADGKSITLGFPGGIGPTDTPIIAALNALGDEGWTVDYIEFDSPDVQTQALMSGDIDIASMGPATVMAADSKGAKLKMVGNNNVLDYLIVGNADVKSCADLDGKKVAYHSEGSTSTAHLRRYLADNCPDAKPDFLVISGSANRITALLEGQIDGTIVRVEDWIAADADPATAHAIDSLVETQSDLLTQTIVIDGSRAEASGPAVAALLAGLDKQFGAVNADPAAFASTAAEILKSDESDVAPVIEALVENGTFPESHELSMDKVEATLAFYKDAGTVEGDLSADDVTHLTLTGGGR